LGLLRSPKDGNYARAVATLTAVAQVPHRSSTTRTKGRQQVDFCLLLLELEPPDLLIEFIGALLKSIK